MKNFDLNSWYIIIEMMMYQVSMEQAVVCTGMTILLKGQLSYLNFQDDLDSVNSVPVSYLNCRSPQFYRKRAFLEM